MKIQPLGDRVLIKRDEAEEKTKSGIILTGNKEQPQIAEVLEVGPGTKDVKMEVKKGDKIVFSKYAGTELKLDDVVYLLISQKDILAIVQ